MSEERNPFLRRLEKAGRLTASHRRSPKQERSLAARVKGDRTAASGAKDVKGDVRRRRVVRIEAKTTKHASFSVTLEMVRKIEEAAAGGAELPVIVVEFLGPGGKPIAELAVVPSYVLDEIGDR